MPRPLRAPPPALVEIKAAPDRFEALACTLSDCPPAREGGRLGQVARGDTTPEFEAAMLRLRPGEICAEPVQTRYGVHLLRLDRKVEGQTLPFEQVHARIAAYLEESAWRRAVAQYVTLLAGEATIAGCDMPALSRRSCNRGRDAGRHSGRPDR